MLQTLKVDSAGTAAKAKDRPEDTSSPSDPAFSGLLSVFAGSFQIQTPIAPAFTNISAAPATQSGEAHSGSRTPSQAGDSNRTAQAPTQRNQTSDSMNQAKAAGDPSEAQTTRKAESADSKEASNAKAANPANPRSDDTQGAAKTPSVSDSASGTATSKSATPLQNTNASGTSSAKDTSAATVPTAPLTNTQELGITPSTKIASTSAVTAIQKLTVDTPAAPNTTATPANAVQVTQTAQGQTEKSAKPGSEAAAVALAAAPEGTKTATTSKANVEINLAAPGSVEAKAPPLQAPESSSNSTGKQQQGVPLPQTFSIALAQATVEGSSSQPPASAASQNHATSAIPNSLASTSPTLKTVMATTTLEAASPTKPNPVITQVEGSIRWILNNHEKGADLQLHPDNLGRITINLKVEGNEVHARIWASESATLPVLQEHRAHLEQSLKEQGLNLGRFDLQSGSRQDTRSQDPNRATSLLPEATRPLEAKQEMPAAILRGSTNGRRIEVYA